MALRRLFGGTPLLVNLSRSETALEDALSALGTGTQGVTLPLLKSARYKQERHAGIALEKREEPEPHYRPGSVPRRSPVRRRASDAGIETRIRCHTFRATGITDYLTNGGRIEVAQRMAGHANAKTTAFMTGAMMISAWVKSRR